jgi:hypothetical protein
VDWLVEANISEKHSVSIFRAEVTMLVIKSRRMGWAEYVA